MASIAVLCCCAVALAFDRGPFVFADEPISRFSVSPAAPGRQLVRTSLPFAPGELDGAAPLLVRFADGECWAAVRPLSWYSANGQPQSVRRALLTFPHVFSDGQPVEMTLHYHSRDLSDPELPTLVTKTDRGWVVQAAAGLVLEAIPRWPKPDTDSAWTHEIAEAHAHFRWQAWRTQDEQWVRRVEVRTDSLGQVVFVAHLQRRHAPGNWCPEFGWDLHMRSGSDGGGANANTANSIGDLEQLHSFADGESNRHEFADGRYSIAHPAAPWKRNGAIYRRKGTQRESHYRYLRCEVGDRVPMQPYSWRRAEMVIAPSQVATLTPVLTSPHRVEVEPQLWDTLYGVGVPLDGGGALLQELLKYHRRATTASAAVGQDWGNVTGYFDGHGQGGVFGMNRLNHCPAIFFEAWRSGRRDLLHTALAWCDNFHDLSIVWGPPDPPQAKPRFRPGGTRYNNLRATNEIPPDDDWSFMWRGDKSKTFCTKGYDSFLLAYEETGDPRMKAALDAQLEYARAYVHANDGECRNIGDVADFVRLYECTGDAQHLADALRLFRELREELGDDHLFSQAGKPIEADPPFIEEDELGKAHPFVKPYIIGYALAGCPRLAKHFPHEPRLIEMVRAVAGFLAESQDPLGGWRYPHPRSSRVIAGQAMEHAWQLVQACELLGAEPRYLDAIERTLRLRIWVWRHTGKMANGLRGWEQSSGRVDDPQKLYAMYEKPADRDSSRDYIEGELLLGSSSPEGIVYFADVLRFYLQHRTAEELLRPPHDASPLGQVLKRVARLNHQSRGVRELLPEFTAEIKKRQRCELSWLNQSAQDYVTWQAKARHHVYRSLLTPPPRGAFVTEVLTSRDYTKYTKYKLCFNLTADSRVEAYLLVPKGVGPFPAVLLLHDHGAEFRIGKEKVVEPVSAGTDTISLARSWVDRYYGGRFLGDELARRGYVCFATDALNWSARGGGGFEGQQALAGNLLHLGMSLAGLIAHEDLRAAEYLAARPEVDPSRIAAMGLSMGCFRTWQLAALSEHITAGVAICWMATRNGLMVPGNNQTEGHSAFTMTHPGLLNQLDYPDIASIACPKPMLFFNGYQDKLFPAKSVQQAYKKMRAVWKSQGVDHRLVTKMWDIDHQFSREMQEEAFPWLDAQLGNDSVDENKHTATEKTE